MNYSAQALASLSSSQILFLESLPKAELHAHLNGSIPLPCLEQLAKNYTPKNSIGSSELAVRINNLAKGAQLDEHSDFFGLFPAIYALTSNVHSLGLAARAVLNEFLKPRPSNSGIDRAPAVPQCSYLELRSTPRETEEMSRMEYGKLELHFITMVQ
jgi:adenosine deaminase